MRKKLIISMFVLLSPLVLFAQGFTFGPKIGVLTSDLTTNWDSLSTAAMNKLEIGLFMRFSGTTAYFQPELLYVTKGGEITNASNTLQQEVEIQAIDLPLMIGLRLGSRRINLRFHAGPVFSFAVNKTISTSQGESFLDEDDFNNVNYSGQAGAGIDIYFLSLDVRYEYGFNNMYKGSGTTSDLSLMHNNYNISLAFKLR